MAIVWFAVIVFLVLLFVFFVPLVNSGSSIRYANQNVVPRQPPMEPGHQPPQYTPQASRTGCQGILAMLVIAALLFVGAVIFWSVAVQAGVL